MKIKDVLQNATHNDDLHSISYFRGRIAADTTSECFRIYPMPYDDNAYFLVNREDVVGDIYELTKEELSGSGFAGVRVYKVPLKLGTKVAYVKIQPHRVGETVDSISFNLKQGPGCHSGDCGGQFCCDSGGGGPCFCSQCCVA